MDVREAITNRRTIKKFTTREVTRAEVEALLDAAVCAPNHRLTQPWRFHVLGPEARYAYGLALGVRKAKKFADDAAKAAELRETVAQEHRALPLMIAVTMTENENPEIRQEDYAAVFMGIQNLALTAAAMGLGTALKTGGVMDDPAARAAVQAAEGERIVAIVNVGEPVEVPPGKSRVAASDRTVWVP